MGVSLSRLWWLGVGLLGGLGAGALGYVSWRWVHPGRWPSPSAGLRGEEFYFSSLDGLRLRGLWLPGREGWPVVLLCHGYFRSLAEPYDLGLHLNDLGYNVLLFDFRGCGKSEGSWTTLGAQETLDVLAAVRAARERAPGAAIGVLGISMGGAAAIMAAARCPDIGAVVADSAYPDLERLLERRARQWAAWPPLLGAARVSLRLGELLAGFRAREVRPVDWVGRIAPRPVLFICGDCDSFVPLEQCLELYERAGEPKELWVVPNCHHALARLDCPDEYCQRVGDFFRRYLGP